jgi:bacteriocin-like protein
MRLYKVRYKTKSSRALRLHGVTEQKTPPDGRRREQLSCRAQPVGNSAGRAKGGSSLRQLTEKELDHVSGGAISDNFVTVNGGGNTPQGNANGIEPTYVNSTNPAGNVPPGQQLT